MGIIAESSTWEEKLYRIQNTDPILGGQDGTVNIQPKQLTNRTAWLKKCLLEEHGDDGSHSVLGTMFAPGAALSENKLELNIPTAELYAALTGTKKDLTSLKADVDLVIGPDGTLTNSQARAVQLLWEYSEFGFDFELWVGDLIMRDIADRTVIEAYYNDDSIDVSTTEGLTPGMHLILHKEAYWEEVVVHTVLDEHRFRVKTLLAGNGSAEPTPLKNAALGHTNWIVGEGEAVGAPGSVYLSRVSSVLAGVPSGMLVVRRDADVGQLRVFFRHVLDGVWVESIMQGNNPVEGYYDESYPAPGGSVQMRIEVSGRPVTVQHLALFPVNCGRTLAPIRTPKMTYPPNSKDIYRDAVYLESSEYRNAYRDRYTETQFQFGEDISNLNLPVFDFRSSEIALDIPEADTPPEGFWQVRCRHRSDMGEWSAWSYPVLVRLHQPEIFFGFKNTERTAGFGEAPYASLQRELHRFGFADALRSVGFGEGLFIFGTQA